MWQLKQEEERRKIQFTGGSTYIISLPKKWIALNQLKKGSYIKLRGEEGGLLTIVPPEVTIVERQDEATIRASPNEDTEVIKRKIVSLYLAGYYSIYIRTDKQQFSAKQRHEIKNFVRRMLVGTEIVMDTSNQLMLQILLSYPELTIQNTLRRMSIITKSMHNDAILMLKTNDTLLAKEAISTDNEVDRFNLYVTRLLRTALQNPHLSKEIGIVNGKDCLSFLIVTRLVERTADHAAKIAENALVLKKQLTNDVMEKIEKMSCIAITMFDTSIESLFRRDYHSAEKIFENIKDIEILERQAMPGNVDIEDSACIRLIIESIRRTAEYACDIAEIVLNLTVDSIVV